MPVPPVKVWDRFGRQMYQSGGLGYTVTGVKWCPNGESFAVGAFNTLRLCDKTGWSHSRDRCANATVDVEGKTREKRQLTIHTVFYT